MKTISVNADSGLPKYKQIIKSVELAISEKRLKRDVKLPSVNRLSIDFSISRDTVLLAYEELKKRGIIYAILGKGYYVKSVEMSFEQRYFLLFDELNSFKEDIYTAFLAALNNKAQVDIYFHHFNLEMFKKLVNESNGNYTKYIVMPSNLTGAAALIKTLPPKDVYVLDQTNPDLSEYPAVYQNFVKDIYMALQEAKSILNQYQKLILIFPGFKEPMGMKIGFESFCSDFRFAHEVISEFTDRTIEKGEVYVIPSDRDLVQVILKSKEQGLVLGKDFGVISYNETPLKKVVENGITTISTDFKQMGTTLAHMVLENRRDQIENKNYLISRGSL